MLGLKAFQTQDQDETETSTSRDETKMFETENTYLAEGMIRFNNTLVYMS